MSSGAHFQFITKSIHETPYVSEKRCQKYICLIYVYKYTFDIGFYIINSIYMIGVKYNVLYLYSII